MTKPAWLCYTELLDFIAKRTRRRLIHPLMFHVNKTGLGRRSDFLKIPRSPDSQSKAVFLGTIVSSKTW